MGKRQDHRVTEDICGVTQIGASGIEWICVMPFHGKVVKQGKVIVERVPAESGHHFINRWPNRKGTDDV